MTAVHDRTHGLSIGFSMRDIFGISPTLGIFSTKLVTIPAPFQLVVGARVTVQFVHNNAPTVNTPTLNVNNTGAKEMWAGGIRMGGAMAIRAGQVYDFVFTASDRFELIGAATNTPIFTGTPFIRATGDQGTFTNPIAVAAITTSRDEVNLPIGAYVGVNHHIVIARNANRTLHLGGADNDAYLASGTGAVLSGTWRSSGGMGNNVYIFRRVF